MTRAARSAGVELIMNPIAEQMYRKRAVDANVRIRVGVAVVICDGTGRVLLEKRRDCGSWGLPGGRIEPGESVLDSAKREVKEETGLNVEITHLIGIYSEPAERIVTYPDNGDVAHLIDVVLGARIVSGELICSNESEEVRFFDSDELPGDLVPPARQPLSDVLHGLVAIVR